MPTVQLAILDGELVKTAFVAANAQLMPERPAFQNCFAVARVLPRGMWGMGECL